MKRILHLRASTAPLGPLEQRLLEALWIRGNATVRELLEDASDTGYKDLAYTTVMTTLARLFKKKLLTRQGEGRAFRYTPRFTREELHREATAEAFRQFLESSPPSAVPLSHLVEILTERDPRLLDDLAHLLENKRRQLRDRSRSKTKNKS